MATTDTDIHANGNGNGHHNQQFDLPSPNLKYEHCYSPWTSNRSPIPEFKDEDLEEPDYNNSHSFYTISNSDYSDMGPITYPVDSSIDAHQQNTYPPCRSSFSVSPAPDRKSSIYHPSSAAMNSVLSSTVSPGLPSQRKPHYAPPSLGSPNLYGSSPRTSSVSVGNGSTIFPSQITKLTSDLNTISEHQPSSLPSSFLGNPPSTLAPPAMNRTHSGTILKSNEKRMFSGPDILPQISFHQNHPDAPPPTGLKGEFEPSAPTMFNHGGGPYSKPEFENPIPSMYQMTLPGMGPVHPAPFSNGAAHSTYFAQHIDEVPTQGIPPQGLLTESFADAAGHSYRKRDYHHIMEDYQPWASPEGLQMQKPSKRRKSSANHPWTLSDDDKYLMKLKDEDQLPWKEIVNRFKEEGRGNHRVPALQMRLKRIKERIRQWTPEDVIGHQFLPPHSSQCYPVRQPPLLIRASG
ncbi:hypothetical protein ABW19_dt0202367 [Dactylella cylindrospora]|nr:hypothetical protein ABW19_dt0202367 [Dactylella cylindrospora]